MAQFSENRIKAIIQDPNLTPEQKAEEVKKWDEGGIYRVAMHTAIGALGGGTLQSAATTGGVAAAAPQFEKIEEMLASQITKNGTEEERANASQIAKGMIGLALIIAGESSGLDASSTTMAVNVEAFNRWLHDSEIRNIFGDGTKLRQFAREQGITYEEAWRAVLAQAYRNADDSFRQHHQPSINSKEAQLSRAAEEFLRKNSIYIRTTAAERASSSQNTSNARYRPLLDSVISNTPKQTQQQVNQAVLSETAKISSTGAVKGAVNIPYDTANSVTQIFGKSPPNTIPYTSIPTNYPYGSEEEANVGAVVQNGVGVTTVLVGGRATTATRPSTDQAVRSSSTPDNRAVQNQHTNTRFIVDSNGRTVDLDCLKSVRFSGQTININRSGTNRPTTGTPNTYSRGTNGHILVFGSDGRRIADISSERIKFTRWNYNQARDTWHPSEGSVNKTEVPAEVLRHFGLN